MTDLKKLNMTELLARHNELAEKLGVATENSFKDLKTARAAVANLEQKMENVTNSEATPTEAEVAALEQPAEAVAGTTEPAVTATAPVDKDKYNSSGKRGPNQGVGAYAKEMILAGKNNADALKAVLEKFPTARTTTGCIAFYRTALSKGPVEKTAEQLRAEAQVLLDKANAVEAAAKAAAEATAAAQKAATEEQKEPAAATEATPSA